MEKNIWNSFRPFKEEEKPYFYGQSQQISAMAHLIGHLRGDFGSGGNEFWTSWFKFRDSLFHDEFCAELDAVVNALRKSDEAGAVLKDRESMKAFCKGHPEAAIDEDWFAFRIDTKYFAYLLRICPQKGNYNFYILCYEKGNLDSRIEKARKGSRFMTTKYEELFRVPDGGKVKIASADGTSKVYFVHYIDEYHVELSGTPYHICELAELLKKNNKTISPVLY